jgi:hypothetical protein
MTTDTGFIQRADLLPFARCAERYCAFLEQEPFPDKAAFLPGVTGLLAELYAAGLVLLTLRPSDERLSIQREVPEQAADVRQKMRRRIEDALSEHSLYWEVFDPFHADELSAQTLDDDLVDIYHDIKGWLLVFQSDSTGTSADDGVMDDVLWHWRFGFIHHWGDHLVDALRALHRAVCALHTA